MNRRSESLVEKCGPVQRSAGPRFAGMSSHTDFSLPKKTPHVPCLQTRNHVALDLEHNLGTDGEELGKVREQPQEIYGVVGLPSQISVPTSRPGVGGRSMKKQLLSENSGESCRFDRDRNAAAYFCSALGLRPDLDRPIHQIDSFTHTN